MTAHKYKTDLRCGACVARVGPLLDAAPDITRWSADVADPNKVLTVEGEVTAERVADVIGPAGYHVLGELREEKPAPVAPAEKPTSYFPLLLVLFYLVGLTAAMEVAACRPSPTRTAATTSSPRGGRSTGSSTRSSNWAWESRI
jgi:copper chaperone